MQQIVRIIQECIKSKYYCDDLFEMITLREISCYSTAATATAAFIIGGTYTRKLVAEYRENQWHPLKSLLQGRSHQASIIVDNHMLIIGGWDSHHGNPIENRIDENAIIKLILGLCLFLNIVQIIDHQSIRINYDNLFYKDLSKPKFGISMKRVKQAFCQRYLTKTILGESVYLS